MYISISISISILIISVSISISISDLGGLDVLHGPLGGVLELVCLRLLTRHRKVSHLALVSPVLYDTLGCSVGHLLVIFEALGEDGLDLDLGRERVRVWGRARVRVRVEGEG